MSENLGRGDISKLNPFPFLASFFRHDFPA